jgi:hypothetical protein
MANASQPAMRCLALATDYDGTLATHGQVDDATVAALERLAASGRKLVLVTGRELPDLRRIFTRLDLFDRVIAENGAVLHRPAARQEKLLCESASERLVTRLREQNVPLSVGRAIIATREPHEVVVLETIRELGLELHVIFNKGAVMVLPSGINKGTGLRRALDELGLSPHAVAAIGDAENDHALLSACAWGVAVANALPAIAQRADFVTCQAHGPGVAELIQRILHDDLPNGRPHSTHKRLSS